MDSSADSRHPCGICGCDGSLRYTPLPPGTVTGEPRSYVKDCCGCLVYTTARDEG
jgi:hypothetical protein